MKLEVKIFTKVLEEQRYFTEFLFLWKAAGL